MFKWSGRMRERGSDSNWLPVEYLAYLDDDGKRRFFTVRKEDGGDIPDGFYVFQDELVNGVSDRGSGRASGSSVGDIERLSNLNCQNRSTYRFSHKPCPVVLLRFIRVSFFPPSCFRCNPRNSPTLGSGKLLLSSFATFAPYSGECRGRLSFGPGLSALPTKRYSVYIFVTHRLCTHRLQDPEDGTQCPSTSTSDLAARSAA
jgi:hypothetical protein